MVRASTNPKWKEIFGGREGGIEKIEEPSVGLVYSVSHNNCSEKGGIENSQKKIVEQ